MKHVEVTVLSRHLGAHDETMQSPSGHLCQLFHQKLSGEQSNGVFMVIA